MAELERVQQNTPVTVSKQWYEAGVAVDPGTVTVGVTRADGTVLIAPGQATTGTTSGPRSFNLTTANTALLDRLTVIWTSTLKGTLTSYVEVVGGFLFNLAEAIADSEITATVAEVAEARIMAEQAFENVTGVAFVPRYEYETLNGDDTSLLVLKWRKVRSVRSVFVDAATIGATELALVTPSAGGVRYPSTFNAGFANVQVGYEHGHSYPPQEVSRAALRLAKHYLTDWAADDRALRIDSEAGSFVMAVPGSSRWDFGIPEVDAVAQRYAFTSLVG